MSLTAQQAAAARAAGSVAVTAGAGTGKTHMLTERYLHHLSVDRLRPLEIVAATFTDRAAAELRGRIRSRLETVPELNSLSPELEAAQIGTLHSLASRICREHPESAGVPYDFAVQDELEQRLWLARNFRSAIANLPQQLTQEFPFDTLVAALESLLADPYTAGQALAGDPGEWPALVRLERERIYRRMRASPSWTRAIAALRENAGHNDDKMEQQRLAALRAVEDFERGEFGAGACQVLDTLSRRPGSRKVWDESTLELLRDACSALRDTFRAYKYIFEMELNGGDEKLAASLPTLRTAYELVQEQLMTAKRRERILDFNDLEIHALQALESRQVREFYHKRWRAFLVDEFQDTNPVQAALLARLTEQARLTVVGDEKQSIYGFRRADLTVFSEVRRQIESGGGDVVELATSFRTHQRLMRVLNDVVAPALGQLHQSLDGARADAPGNQPHLSLHLICNGPSLKQFRQRAEAHLIGELIDGLVAEGSPVHDKETGALRPARPGDIAVLARTWDTLSPYADELAARGIPTIHAGGGNLLAQREAKDAISLLRFIADPSDDLALATVLRSPFFAWTDSELLRLASAAAGAATTWWQALERKAAERLEPLPATSDVAGEGISGAADDALRFAHDVLVTLLEQRALEPPSTLLIQADELTGYTAVIANLPGGLRRLADWRGLTDFVRRLEEGHNDAFTVVRELRDLGQLENGKVARPGMEAGDAVSLMSVHNAKGLEWPIVILPDITSSSASHGVGAVFETGAGVAFKVRDDDGEEVEPALFKLLNERRKQRDADEETRVLYVALTRARDRILITGSAEQGGRLEALRPGLETAGVVAELVPFDPEWAVPKNPQAQAASEQFRGTLLGPTGPGLRELPVSSLSTYQTCPKRFHFEQILQHPGAGEGSAIARRVGILTHLALERGLTDAAALERLDPTLDSGAVQRALGYARTFRTSPVFETVRSDIDEHEQRLVWSGGELLLRGIADAVGADFVLDYKTGSSAEAHAHLLQVAVYAQALGRKAAHVAYLGSEELRTYRGRELEDAMDAVRAVLDGISAGDFAAKPSPERCGACAYANICDDSAVQVPLLQP